MFFTQITMEAAEDPEFLDAMRAARIRGALVGVESVTPEGLKSIYKNFNLAGDALATRLRMFRERGVHVLGSFIFGLPSDRPDTFDATADVAERAGLTFAQFVMLTPFPGTLDFDKWTSSFNGDTPEVGGVPITRHWLIPAANRPKFFMPHPRMSPDEIRERTQGVWDRFYGTRQVWSRSSCVKSMKGRLAFVLISKLYRQMYANTGISTDSARGSTSVRWARWLLAIPVSASSPARKCRTFSDADLAGSAGQRAALAEAAAASIFSISTTARARNSAASLAIRISPARSGARHAQVDRLDEATQVAQHVDRERQRIVSGCGHRASLGETFFADFQTCWHARQPEVIHALELKAQQVQTTREHPAVRTRGLRGWQRHGTSWSRSEQRRDCRRGATVAVHDRASGNVGCVVADRTV